MIRTEAIATITAAVPQVDYARLAAITDAITEMASLGTETVRTVSDVILDMKTDEPSLRPLTRRELQLIAQSKHDFATGQTLGTEEAFARIDAGPTARRAACAKA